MPNKLGLINHGPDILRTMRHKSWANFLRYMHENMKWNVRVVTVAIYIAGIGFSIGFFAGVAIS